MGVGLFPRVGRLQASPLSPAPGIMNKFEYLFVVRAPSNPRNKVALKVGHSLMDWIRLGNSGVDLTGTGGKLLKVTREELAKHRKEDDAWIAIRDPFELQVRQGAVGIHQWALDRLEAELRHQMASSSNIVERQYTPIMRTSLTSDTTSADIILMVKAYPDGVFSSWITSGK
ncbi:unnamed protein product, partial [Nesidiocoris tenuis]